MSWNSSPSWTGLKRIPSPAKSFRVPAGCASYAGRWPDAAARRRRVIYFWWLSDEKILLLDIYAKNEKEDLSADELKKLKQKVKP